MDDERHASEPDLAVPRAMALWIRRVVHPCPCESEWTESGHAVAVPVK